ncbi:MAG: PAS domain-containing sensor histidine kinase [Flavobacteriaceae bacterium]
MAQAQPLWGGSRNGVVLPAVARLARSRNWPLLDYFDRFEGVFRTATGPLLVTFFLLVGAACVINIHQTHVDMIGRAKARIELVADSLSRDLAGAASDGSTAMRHAQALIAGHTGELTTGYSLAVTAQSGLIEASTAQRNLPSGADLSVLLGEAMPVALFGSRAGVMETAMADGGKALVTVRDLPAPLGQVAVVFPFSEIWGWTWRRAGFSTVIFAVTDFVLLLIGAAFLWQTWRLNESDALNATTRSRVETALRRGHCGLWDWDVTHGRIFWSASMGALLGMPPRDRYISFGELVDLTHPEDADIVALANAMSDGDVSAVDQSFRMRTAEGGWIWVRARGEVNRNEEGEVHLVGIAIDITEQKRLAERSAAADERLRSAVESISEAFVIWDAQDRMVMCNRKYQEMHGLSEHDVSSNAAYTELLAESPTVLEGADRFAKSLTGKGRSFEAKLKDGRWFAINDRRTKDGGFVSVGTDITALKQHEVRLLDSERTLLATVTDLRQSRQKLEQQAQQLVELAERYSEEKTKAEQANAAKSRFLATMSHELRTPLNAIIGFSEIMEGATFGPLGSARYTEYCQDIKTSGQYLLDVINDVLDMSRIEAGRYEIEHNPVDVSDIVDESVRIMSARAQEKNIATQIDIASGLALEGDRRAVKQIVLNLLSNAVKFTPPDGSIKVRARAVRGGINIAIEDTGIGIPKSAIRKLGRPFEQVENQYSRTYPGSGLGLAISRSLAELHGGTLRIRSTEGKGTIVTVRLPQKPHLEAAGGTVQALQPA